VTLECYIKSSLEREREIELSRMIRIDKSCSYTIVRAIPKK